MDYLGLSGEEAYDDYDSSTSYTDASEPVRAGPLPPRVTYATRAEALASPPCSTATDGEPIVLEEAGGRFSCEVQRGDPPE